MAFALISPEAFKGDFTKDTTHFQTQNLESFDLQVDSKSLVGYPISKTGDIAISFYYRFLKECNFYNNNYSSGPMDFESFKDFNFMIVENLKRKNITMGQLTAVVKFKQILSEKLYLLIMPVYKKNLSFDEYFIPEVSESTETTDMEFSTD